MALSGVAGSMSHLAYQYLYRSRQFLVLTLTLTLVLHRLVAFSFFPYQAQHLHHHFHHQGSGSGYACSSLVALEVLGQHLATSWTPESTQASQLRAESTCLLLTAPS